MKTLQEYISTFRGIASNLNIVGDSSEILVQLLANATYINEVDQISYSRESSIDKSVLVNSKIQHCMDNMYSVYRGQCPRVLLRFRPMRYFNFNLYDEILTSSTFRVHYIGYINEKGTTASTSSLEDINSGRTSKLVNIEYGPLSVPPSITDNESEYVTIVGILSKEIVSKEWETTENNPYFVECYEEGLSNDLQVKINGDNVSVTRNFSDHILNKSVYDLTTTSFGSRLYVSGILGESSSFSSQLDLQVGLKVQANWFKYSELSEYNPSELRRIVMKGGEMKKFSEEFLTSRGNLEEINDGVLLIDSSKKDSVQSIHYLSNRDRYLNSLLRSNRDIGRLLEESYPDYVKIGSTKVVFSNNIVTVYYVPSTTPIIDPEELFKPYRENMKSYYIMDDLYVKQGNRIISTVTVELGLNDLNSGDNVKKELDNIFSEYSGKLGVDLTSSEIKEEIKSAISKISEVKVVKSLVINFKSSDGNMISAEEVKEIIAVDPTYFDIDVNFRTVK